MDNLRFLRATPDESVDLISIDPPFGKMDTFTSEAKPPITEAERREEEALFVRHGLALENPRHRLQLLATYGSLVKDIWRWNRDIEQVASHARFMREIERAPEGSVAKRIYHVITSTMATAGEGQAAYVTFMAVRLAECHRILKDTGSIYVHCDYKSDSHLRMLLDAIFGGANLRNEIVWCYTGPGSPNMKNFPRKHDTILRYTKSDRWTFNADAVRIPHKDGFEAKTRKTDDNIWGAPTDEQMERYKKGKIVESWWTDIPGPWYYPKSEKTGYATQKPLALAKRIIEASSNPGDIVMDVFAGCATTLIAAELLGRRWVGCDFSYRAWTMNQRRFYSIPDEDGGPILLSDTTQATIAAVGERQAVRRETGYTLGPDDVEPKYQWLPDLEVAKPARRASVWNGRYTKDEARNLMLNALGKDKPGTICWGCGWEPTLPDRLTPDDSWLEVEHVWPRNPRDDDEGGDDELYNLGLLCRKCNGRKGNRPISLEALRLENAADGRIWAPEGVDNALQWLDGRVPLAKIRQWANRLVAAKPGLGY